MSEEQIVDSSIKRIEYKIEKAVPKTDRKVVEKKVEINNIKQLKDKADN